MTQDIGAPTGPTITNQDAFDDAVRKIKLKMGESYNYIIPHQDAVDMAMGKPTKMKVRVPTLARLSEVAQQTGMWTEKGKSTPTLAFLNSQATHTGQWGMGDAAVPTLTREQQTFTQGVDQAGVTGVYIVPKISARSLIGEFDIPTNEATRAALRDTLKRQWEAVYTNSPTDMQLDTLIDAGELKNVTMSTVDRAKLETDISAQTGTIRGKPTLSYEQLHGWDRQEADGTTVHVYGANEIQLISQQRDFDWSAQLLQGYEYVDETTGETRRVLGSQEWQDHVTANDQAYQTALRYGGYVAAIDENGVPFVREIEGSNSLDEKQKKREDQLVRDGWKDQFAENQAQWEREQKNYFGYWKWDPGRFEPRWVPGTIQLAHDLAIDTLEVQDALQATRDRMTHVRSLWFLKAQQEDREDLAKIEQDWKTAEAGLDRISREHIVELGAQGEIDALEWKMEFERTNDIIDAVSGGSYEVGRWLWNKYVTGDDDAPFPDLSDPVAVGAYLAANAAPPAVRAAWAKYVADHPELETAATAFVVKGADGTELGTFTTKEAAERFVTDNPGSKLEGATYSVLDADGVKQATFPSKAAADAYIARNPGFTLESAAGAEVDLGDGQYTAMVNGAKVTFNTEAEAEEYARTHEGVEILDPTGNVASFAPPPELEQYWGEGLDGTNVYTIDGAEYTTRADATVALDELKLNDPAKYPFSVKNAEGATIARFATEAEQTAYIAANPGTVKGRGSVLGAGKELTASDWIQAALAFGAGWTKGGNNRTSAGAMLTDGMALAGFAVTAAMTSAVCFPLLGSAYMAGLGLKSIYESWKVPPDRKKARDASNIDVALSSEIKSAMLKNLPQEALDRIPNSQGNIRIVINTKPLADYDENTSKPTDSPPVIMVEYRNEGNVSPVSGMQTNETIFYTETLSDWMDRTGYAFMSWLGAEGEAFNNMPEGLRQQLMTLRHKPSSMLIHPDGYVSFLDRENKAIKGFTREEMEEYAPGMSGVASKRVNPDEPDERGIHGAAKLMDDIVTLHGVERDDLSDMTGVLPVGDGNKLLEKLARPGYKFTMRDINDIFKDEQGNLNAIGGTTGYLLFLQLFVEPGLVELTSDGQYALDELGA